MLDVVLGGGVIVADVLDGAAVISCSSFMALALLLLFTSPCFWVVVSSSSPSSLRFRSVAGRLRLRVALG